MQFLFCLLFFPFIIQAQNQTGTFTDSRDNKTYSWVKIGEQTWMSENLNFNTKKSKCYDNNESNCEKNGRLYKWRVARKICPSGWHLPEMSDFRTLINTTCVIGNVNANLGALNGNINANLRSIDGWEDKTGTNKSGFNALASGICILGKSSAMGKNGYYWSSTRSKLSFGILARFCWFDNKMVYHITNAETGKTNLMSVRCLKD